jgi:hypothetical protein
VTAMDEEPTLLENSQMTGHHWLGIELRKRGRNAFALGARITVTNKQGKRIVREVRSGGGYLSQNDLRALFGLGTCTGPVTVEVGLLGDRWRWADVAVDRYTKLTLDDGHRVRP